MPLLSIYLTSCISRIHGLRKRTLENVRYTKLLFFCVEVRSLAHFCKRSINKIGLIFNRFRFKDNLA